jgi:hypothetical protein
VHHVQALLARRAPAAGESVTADLVMGPGMSHVHAAGCPMVRGKTLGAVASSSALARCPICLPEEPS